MFCKYCGNALSDEARFCAFCGARTDDLHSDGVDISDDALDDAMPDPHKEERAASERKILTLGICSVAFVCTFFFALIGWILAGVCRGKIRGHEARFGELGPMGRVGRGLSLGGFIGGIVMTVFATLYLVICIASFYLMISGYYDYPGDFDLYFSSAAYLLALI